ncbi:MAG: hypothetical protein Q8O13_11175 [Candidatus Omnitrophota bacterium]|nr:hypothetical protein [Candidatus Omnitrophota bacterium]
MGVVYKLTDKVKDFIISQKKANPNLSCRGLANIVKKRFQITLSKSSINDIIKQAGLSSSVGMRPKLPGRLLKQEPREVPKISAAEKKELLTFSQERTPVLEQPKPLEKVAEFKPEEKKQVEIRKNKWDVSLIKGSAEEPQLIEIKGDEIIDNLGFFFFKAVEWRIADKPILAMILKPFLSAAIAQDLEIKAQILVYLFAFGSADLEAMTAYSGKGLWLINQLNNPQALSALPAFVESLKAIKGLTLGFLSGVNHAFTEVNFFKIILADNTVIYLDGKLHSLWQEADIPAVMSSTLYESKSYIKNIFQDNVQSVILFTAPGYLNFSKSFYEFVYACEDNPQKRMLRISLHNHQKDEISAPVKIPGQKRFFSMGFWPWQEEGARFIHEDIRLVNSFFCEALDKTIYFSEIKVNLPQYQSFQGLKIRAALLRDWGLSWPRLGVLTNQPFERPMEEIITEYLTRWPNLDEGYQDFLKKSEKSLYTQPQKALGLAALQSDEYALSSGKLDLWQNLNYLVSHLNNFCSRHFFPKEYEKADFSTLKQRFYSLPGKLDKRNNNLSVTFILPSDYAFQKELMYAIRRVNESNIKDPQNHRLWLKLK